MVMENLMEIKLEFCTRWYGDNLTFFGRHWCVAWKEIKSKMSCGESDMTRLHFIPITPWFMSAQTTEAGAIQNLYRTFNDAVGKTKTIAQGLLKIVQALLELYTVMRGSIVWFTIPSLDNTRDFTKNIVTTLGYSPHVFPHPWDFTSFTCPTPGISRSLLIRVAFLRFLYMNNLPIYNTSFT